MTGAADVSFPPQGRGLLYRDAGLHIGWQNTVLVSLCLLLENFPRRHGYHARPNAFGQKVFVGFGCKADFASRRDDDHLRISAGCIREHVGSLRNTGCRRIFTAIESGQRLTRQCQYRGLVPQLHDVAVCLDYLVGVARPYSDKSRYRTQAYQVFDWLMSRPIFAVAHGLMGKDKERG